MKHWPRLVCSLLLSSGIWFIHSISQLRSDVVSVSVVAKSNIPGRSESSSDEVQVVARCTAQGYVLLYYKYHRAPVIVGIAPEHLVQTGEDSFTVSSTDFERYCKDIFSETATVESFLKDSFTFTFPSESCRKVPVHLVEHISCKPQYMTYGAPVIKPDSVLVYGRPDIISTVEHVLTAPVSHSDLDGGAHGMTRLEKIPGVRFSDSQVSYNIDVVRFVEIRSRVEIVRRNVPAGTSFQIYPSSADAVFKCRFPLTYNPSDPSEFYIDYDEFISSISGKCMIRCDGLPDGVLDLSIEPEYCDCIIEDNPQ